MYIFSLETFGRRGEDFSTFLKRMAKKGESRTRRPAWQFWQWEVPKINAMLIKGNLHKAMQVRDRINADLADRYTHTNFHG